MGHRHRSALKQHNKAFKGSSSKPKSLKEKRKAAAAAAAASAANRAITKADRVQQSKLRRLQHRRELQQRQTPNAGCPPPKVVLLVPFSDAVCIEKVFLEIKRALLQGHSNASLPDVSGLRMEEDEDNSGDTAAKVEHPQSVPQLQRYLFTLPAYARNPAIPKKYPQQLLILPAPSMKEPECMLDDGKQEGRRTQRKDEILRFMDLASSCDVMLCVFGGNCTYSNSAFSTRGYQVLQALKLQGLPPSVIGVGCTNSALLEPGHSLQGKAVAAESIKFMHRYFNSELGAERSALASSGATRDNMS